MKAWEDFLKQQERELGVDTVGKWLRTLHVDKFDACNLYLEAQDAFQIMWFEEHIRKKATLQLQNNNQKPIKIHIAIKTKTPQPPQTPPTKNHKPTLPPEKFTLQFDQLDPLTTLANFIPTEGNLLAHKLLSKLTNFDVISGQIISGENEFTGFNPIYIYGGEGTGKTHLLMATAHAMLSQRINALYVRAETFTDHVVKAIRAGEMSLFRQAYRNNDVLLIDDVHLFSRKGATQEELFHTFNTLHMSGKQIILSSKCAPSELQNIEPRLVSRFEWGITLPLDPLSKEEIAKILDNKTEALEFKLHPKVREFLLETFTNSSKTVTRALEALILRHHLREQQERRPNTPLTAQLAKFLLKDLMDQEVDDALTPEKIIQIVAEYFGIRSQDLCSKQQTRDFALPRHLAIYLCRQKLKLPYKKIGDIFLRDHSTIMSSVKLVEAAFESDDKEFTTPYHSIKKKLVH